MAIDPNERPPLFTPETEELVREMLKNPDVSPKFRRLLKEANPKAVLPLIDLEDSIAKIQEGADKKVGEALHEVGKLKAELKIKDERSSLKAAGLSEAEIGEVEKLMQEKGITDYTIAANAFRYARQLATPTPSINKRPAVTHEVPKEIMEKVATGDTSELTQWSRTGAYDDLEAFNRAQQR